jgi:hypothetical protein
VIRIHTVGIFSTTEWLEEKKDDQLDIRQKKEKQIQFSKYVGNGRRTTMLG